MRETAPLDRNIARPVSRYCVAGQQKYYYYEDRSSHGLLDPLQAVAGEIIVSKTVTKTVF